MTITKMIHNKSHPSLFPQNEVYNISNSQDIFIRIGCQYCIPGNPCAPLNDSVSRENQILGIRLPIHESFYDVSSKLNSEIYVGPNRISKFPVDNFVPHGLNFKGIEVTDNDQCSNKKHNSEPMTSDEMPVSRVMNSERVSPYTSRLYVKEVTLFPKIRSTRIPSAQLSLIFNRRRNIYPSSQSKLSSDQSAMAIKSQRISSSELKSKSGKKQLPIESVLMLLSGPYM